MAIYSIAQAKDDFSRLVQEAETGTPVTLTRRGRPVAVLVSMEDFAQMRQRRADFWTMCRELRSRFDLEKLDIRPEEVFAVPKDSTGKDFSW